MLLRDAAADYIKHARHGLGLTLATCESYQANLRHYTKWLETDGGCPTPDLTALSTPMLRRYLYAQSALGKRPRTIAGLFHTIKALSVFLIAQGVISSNPVVEIQLPKKDAPVRPVASDEECASLLSACERLRSPRRVALASAIFHTLIFTGLRAMEVLDLEMSDVAFDRGTLTVRQGKGKKSRTLYPTTDTMVALRNWIALRGQNVETSYLFAFDRRRRVAYGGLLKMLHEVKLIAGFADRKHIQPHALRRAFATRLMQRGASIRTIQSAMGHSDANTTFMYLSTSQREVTFRNHSNCSNGIYRHLRKSFRLIFSVNPAFLRAWDLRIETVRPGAISFSGVLSFLRATHPCFPP